MMVQVMTVALVCQEIFTQIENKFQYTEDFAKFHHWFQIEVAITLSAIISLVFFLLMRSCFRHRGMKMQLKNCFAFPQTDFLDAEMYVTAIIITMTVPFVVVQFIERRMVDYFPDDPGRPIVRLQYWFSLAQVAMVYYLVFVGYHKSPKWAGMRWISVGPCIHLVMLLASQVVIPIMVLVHTIYLIPDFRGSVFEGPLLLYPFISLCVLIQFPKLFW